MYKPIQCPHILNQMFNEIFDYQESFIPELGDFVICMWSIQGRNPEQHNEVENIILPDGCIDLILSVTDHTVGFSGMSNTNFNFVDRSEDIYVGFRMKPGAFHALFGLPAYRAMDQYLNIQDVDPNFKINYDQSLESLQDQMIQYLIQYIKNKKTTPLMALFDEMWKDALILNVQDLASKYGYSERQMQRHFKNAFALNPKMIINIIRFQKSLYAIIYQNKTFTEIALLFGYYDQAHFNNEIKKNMGITPRELLMRYNMTDISNKLSED